MAKNFNSKYNIGQSVAEGIYNDLTKAFEWVEVALFDKAFNKFKTIKGKIPSRKIKALATKRFKILDNMYKEASKNNNNKLKYRIIVKYYESVVNELDKNNMYLPSLRDISNWT